MLYTQFLCKEHPDGNYIIKQKEDSEKEQGKDATGKKAQWNMHIRWRHTH